MPLCCGDVCVCSKDFIYIIYLFVYHIILDVLSPKNKLLVRRFVECCSLRNLCLRFVGPQRHSVHLISFEVLGKIGKTSEGFPPLEIYTCLTSKLFLSCQVVNMAAHGSSFDITMIMLAEVRLLDNINISIPRTIYLVQKSCLVHQRFLNISFPESHH